MLNSDSRPTKPAATAAIALSWSGFGVVALARPTSVGPKIVCSIGEAIESTAMPAVTLRNSTPQIIQNDSVLWASSRWTSPAEIRRLVLVGATKPSGAQFSGGHAVHQRADRHHDEIDDAEREEGLHHAGRTGGGLEAGDIEAGHDGAAAHQQVGERGADHRAAAEAHDRHAGRHAAPVRKPLDQRRDRRDVAEAEADAAEHAEAEVEQPELVQVHGERAEHEAAAPADGRDEAGLARAGPLEPAAEQRRRDAEE